ncbi:trypsin-like cysteine/serine peptidase domain-containing protein [Mycena amicta]|nr:trypsin-like cysteine/serine peptidase domain-containing protein [Mycena amicta]
MSGSTRRLRSASKILHETPSISGSTFSSMTALQLIEPGSRLAHLQSSELALLRAKQRKLKAQALGTVASLPNPTQYMRTALEASLIFAQEEAGSAVCVDPAGWVLTCAHCIAETAEEFHARTPRWLLFYTGLAVQVECKVWDAVRDLALLKITAVESTTEIPSFEFIRISDRAPATGTPIVCIGQPGQDDLESKTAQRTNYPFIFVSDGRVRGMVPGADPQDNAEIGSLKHDAWTYWGHSGAPLIRTADGTLVGLHSSWDDKTAMRHGVPHAAIQEFLRLHLHTQNSA